MAGAIRIPLTHYTAGTLLSLLPGLIAALIFGHQITMALEDPSKVSYVVIASTAAGLAAAIYVAGQLAKIRSSKGLPAPTRRSSPGDPRDGVRLVEEILQADLGVAVQQDEKAAQSVVARTSALP